MTIRAVFAILTVFSILSIFTIFAVDAILTIRTRHLDFVAIVIQQPFAIDSPIVNTICILLNTYNGSVAVIAIYTILTVGAIFAVSAVINGNRIALGKSDCVTNGFARFYNRSYTCNVVVVSQGSENRLHRRDVAIHLFAHLFERRNTPLQIFNILTDSSVVIRLRTTDHQTK